jgi:hypothetical protein
MKCQINFFVLFPKLFFKRNYFSPNLPKNVSIWHCWQGAWVRVGERAGERASERACKRGCDKALFFIAFRKRTWLKKRYGHYLTNEWTYERTSGRTNWQTNKHTIKVMNKQTNERTNERTSEPDKSASKSIIYHSFFLLKS